MKAVRDSLKLLATTASDVSLVTTAATCKRLADSLDAKRGMPRTSRHVYTYKIGPGRFGIEDPTDATFRFANGDRVFTIFSSSFVLLKSTGVRPWTMDQSEWDPLRP